MKQSILPSQLQTLFADIFEVPVTTIRPDSSPDTIETWDSIRHLNLVLALEQQFNVQFEPEEIVQLLSLELTADLLNEKLNGSAA